MSDVLNIKPISVKSMGRPVMSCLRCKAQKMKCSKDHPRCKACVNSNKECQYKTREKQIVLLGSQFQKIQSRVKFLENELRKARELQTEEPKVSVKDPSEATTNESTTHSDAIESDDYEEFIDPFDEDFHEHDYFGTATCQMFDSSLNSFLFKFTHKTDDNSNEINYVNQNSRYFLEDPSADKPFSGVLMLPDKEYSIFLIQKVVSFLGHEYFFINPEEFFQKVEDTYESFLDRDPTWLCYLLITLAVGEQFLNESSDGDAPGMRFFNSSLQMFRNYYESPSLELVQTLLLFAFYQQGLNRVNAAFSFYGLAVRNALTMGLHRKNIDPNMSAIEKEKRKRVWWTVFVMDSIWSAKISQPVHIQIEDTEVDLPNVNFVSLNDEFDPELLTFNVKLGVILSKIMTKIYRPNSTTKGINLKSIIECLDDLDHYQNSLPSRIRYSLFMSSNRSVANLYLRLNQAVIITTRPLVLSIFKGIYDENAITRRVVQKCTVAAKTTIDMLKNLKNNGWVSTFGFWDAQYCFSSLLILIMSSLSGHHFPQIEIGRQINGFMKNSGNFTAAENHMRLEELDYLLKKVNEQRRQAILARRNGHSNQQQVELMLDNQFRGPQDHNNPIVNNDLLQIKNKESPVSALINEISGNFSAYDSLFHDPNYQSPQTIKSSRRASINQTNNLDHNDPHVFNLDHPNNDNKHAIRFGTLRLDQELDGEGTKSLANSENINVFKDDLSPDTWNSLVLNLQLWDSSSMGLSLHNFKS